MKSFVAAAILMAGAVSAQAPLYGQCGGQGWTGPTTCVSGATCTYSNPWYSQCLPGSTNPTTTTPGTTTRPTTTTTGGTLPTDKSGCTASRTKFKYFGVNEAGAEFGEGKIPGVLGTDYTWPTRSSVDYFIGKGFNTFRIAFTMERVSPPSQGLTGSFDATYLAALKDIASYVTSKGGYAVLDPHNYARYNGAVITNYSAFTTWWKNLSNQFKSDSKIIFDINNEPNGISATDAFNLNQAGVNGIRSSGATSQLILVEGTAWSGAWSWTSSGNAAAYTAIKDPNNNIAIEMHQYLDSDSSGTSGTCVSSTIGVERIQGATAWLKANNFKGFLGELGAGSNDQCIAAIKGALCHMQTSGVWIGALWWAAGPWWGTYFQSMEPPSGASISRILPEAWQPFL